MKRIVEARQKGWVIVGVMVMGLWTGFAAPGGLPSIAAQTTRPVDVAPDRPTGAFLTLVEKGVARATIVVRKDALKAPPDPRPAEIAAEIPLATKIAGATRDLQVYVEKITGAKLPIVGDEALPAGTVIFVGRSAQTKPFDNKIPSGLTSQRNEEGYLIFAKGDRLLLAGNEAEPYHGTEYAVAAFLNRQGVRWYMPGDFGDVVPKRPSLYVAEMEVRGKPAFRLRNWWGTTSPESNLAEYRWKLRNGLNPTGNLIAMPGDSSVRSVLPPKDSIKLPKDWDKLKAADRAKLPDPYEIFAKHENGLVNEFMPNLTSPLSVKYAAEKVKEYFRKNPKAGSYGIAPDDGLPRDFTAATVKTNLGFPDLAGRLGVPAEMSASEEWLRWIDAVQKKVRKEFPDRFITTNGYANRNTPPIGVKFDPDTPIMFAAIWADTIHAFDNPRSWQAARHAQMLKRWTELSRNVFLYNVWFACVRERYRERET